jgi:predicted NAD/FAD-dependent oxidoreductase
MITKDSQWNLLQHTLKTHGMLPEHFFKSYIVTLKNWYPSREKLISFIRENYDKYALDAYDPMCSYSILCALEAIAEPPLGLGEEKPLTLLASPVVLEKIPMLSRPQEKRIAIIGGGIAGLSCAWHLQQRNITATIFEQASHCGGRIITKQEQTMRFDMGAPFFTANHPYFRKFVDYWEKKGHLQQWKGQIYVDNRQAGLNLSKHPFVGLPSMASLVRLLNSEQQTVFRTPITRLEKVQGGWRLFSNAKDCGFFDSVVLAVPSAISYALLGSAPDLQQHIKPCLKFLPIWVIAAGFAQKLPTPYDALAVTQSSFTYAFRESSKPQRSKKEAWVLHAHLQWSQDNLGITEEQASAKIIEAFLSHLKVSTLTATYSAAKLWKRAYVEKPLGKPCLYADGIGICGDWLLGRRIEDAFLSGAHMATELIRTG